MTSSNFIAATLLFLFATTSGTVANETQPGASERFFEIVETHLAEMTASKYQHKTEIDEKARVWNCDCSGFIGHILRRHFPEAYLHVDGPTFPNRIRPLAANYYETFIEAGQNSHPNSLWKRITKVTDFRPGDIFAWKKIKIVEGKTTGHVLMIAGIPKLDDNGLYRVRIVDSTTSLHANDSRTKESLGLGSGDFWLSADKDGILNGFKNSDHRKLSLQNTCAAGRILSVTGPDLASAGKDSDYLFLSSEAARRLAEERKIKSRIIKEEGKPTSVTRRIDDTRINFIVKNGKVIRTIRGADSSCQRNRAGRKKDVIRSLEVEAFPRSAI